METQTATKNEVFVARIFDAPRELVWKAWVDPELLKKWWGPKDFSVPFFERDLRVGGGYRYSTRSPDGRDIRATGVYRQIVPGERLVTVESFSDERGNAVPATYYGLSPEFPQELRTIVTFEEREGKTKVALQHVDFPAGEINRLTASSWSQSFDKLAQVLRDMR